MAFLPNWGKTGVPTRRCGHTLSNSSHLSLGCRIRVRVDWAALGPAHFDAGLCWRLLVCATRRRKQVGVLSSLSEATLHSTFNPSIRALLQVCQVTSLALVFGPLHLTLLTLGNTRLSAFRPPIATAREPARCQPWNHEEIESMDRRLSHGACVLRWLVVLSNESPKFGFCWCVSRSSSACFSLRLFV